MEEIKKEVTDVKKEFNQKFEEFKKEQKEQMDKIEEFKQAQDKMMEMIKMLLPKEPAVASEDKQPHDTTEDKWKWDINFRNDSVE